MGLVRLEKEFEYWILSVLSDSSSISCLVSATAAAAEKDDELMLGSREVLTDKRSDDEKDEDSLE